MPSRLNFSHRFSFIAMIRVVYVAAAAAAKIGGRRRGNVAVPSIVVAFIAVWLFSSPAWAAPPRDGEAQTLAGAGSAAALMEFKNSLVSGPTGVAVERALVSWNLSTSPCVGNVGNWFGVRCFNGDVMGLQLDNLNLAGDIDVDALLPLRFLRILSFEHNNFEGLMPDWKKLGALKSLFLSNNRLSGQIADDAFSSMGSLKKVHLANNKFTGKIPTSLATTARLLELRLENNAFTGHLPEFRAGLTVFNASNNQLDGPIPPALSSLDPSVFSGNKGLCGKPLKSSCDAQSPPPKPSPHGGGGGGATNAETPSSSSSSKILMILAICLLAVAILISLLIISRGSGGGQENSQAASDKGTRDPLFSPYNNAGASPASGGTATTRASPSSDRAAGGSTPNTNSSSRAGDASGASPAVGKLAFMRADRTHFDLQDLLRASAEVLGTGSLGSSYKAVLMDGQSVVVKRFKHMNLVEREDFHEHMRRIARLEHPNLLPLIAYYYRKEEKLMISDFMSSGSLAAHLHGKESRLEWAKRLKIIKGVAKALMYLHKELSSMVLPHGHLKSSNVLLDKSSNPIVMDYALVPVVNPDELPSLLTAYKSPEYTNLHRPTRKTDVWNLGVLILETLTATSPSKHQDSQLRTWISSIAAKDAEADDDRAETIFDSKMAGDAKNSRGQMRKLLKIGVACCHEDPEARLELKEAAERIEALKERDNQ
ncbi:PREDICTED: pollen receptor-like kinase 1 [Ipomoea nil]|uniref:pollen receptor-like kinase 1 n=1 Tax=Ipomoea nil TaxID=35883 RepID=UPI000901C5C8|nr:PREDICTED: pollen receptor-like kinase 1 [Ipomoea nil]